MNIMTIYYLVYGGKVIFENPYKIVRETEKCFFTENGYRYIKSEIGKPYLKSATTYPYIELVMVDADEQTLRKELSKWFADKASMI